MKKIIICMMMILTTTVSGWAQEVEVIDNAKVLEYLYDRGWGSDLIIKRIEGNKSSININDDDFITKVNNKSQDLAKWLMTSYNPKATVSTSSLAPGVYWVNPDGEYVALTPNTFKKEESAATKILNKGRKIMRDIGIGGILGVGGLNKILDFSQSFDLYKASLGPSFKSEKVVIDDPTSDVKLAGDRNTNPQFLFNLSGSVTAEAANGDVHAMLKIYNQILSKNFTPNDFKCVKLDKKKKNRSMPAGLSFNASGIFYSQDEKLTSVSKKRFVDFKTTKQNDGTYIVTFEEALEVGEYCFVLEKFEEAQAVMCYDFTVE